MHLRWRCSLIFSLLLGIGQLNLAVPSPRLQQPSTSRMNTSGTKPKICEASQPNARRAGAKSIVDRTSQKQKRLAGESMVQAFPLNGRRAAKANGTQRRRAPMKRAPSFIRTWKYLERACTTFGFVMPIGPTKNENFVGHDRSGRRRESFVTSLAEEI